MAWTQADIDKLQSAIADGRGARSISFGDQSVTFNSPREMLELLAHMRREVNTTPTRTHRFASTRKGV